MDRTLALLVTLTLLAAGLAGCIGDETADGDGPSTPDDAGDRPSFVPPVPDRNFTDAIDVNHPDHQNPASHTEGHGFTVAGYTDFAELYEPEQQVGWTEVDIQGHLAAVASYKGFNGITLVNLSDPADPTPISMIPSAGDDYDARLSDDGRYVFFGCQSGDTADAQGVLGDCTRTTPGAPSDRTSGVLAYDVSDPSEPELAGFLGGVNTHNVWTATIDGSYYVFTNGVEILRFDPTPGVDEALETVAEVPGTHDAFVDRHPVTGDWLLYTGSSEDDSFAIYNVTDPANPEVLVDGGFEGVVGWHKQVASSTLIDGRALLVVGGEVFQSDGTAGGAPIPKISVVDVTDPTAPEPMSSWQLPVSELPPWVNYRWSPHNIDITPHGQISVAWNHAGMWVFDVSTQERQQAPVTLGFFQPHETPPPRAPTANPTGDVAVPRVWGGVFDHHGYLVLADMYTGLYVLEPGWGLYGS